MSYINIPGAGSPQWKPPVANSAALPTVGNQSGDTRVTLDDQAIHVWDGVSTWVAAGGGGGGAWGSITGTLSDQTDLQTALNNKQASDAQLSSLAALSYTGNSLKAIRVNVGETDFELFTPGTGTIGGSTGGTDNVLLRADGTGGSTLQNSTVTLSDAGNFASTLSGTITGDSVGLNITQNQGGTTSAFYTDGSGGIWGMRGNGYSAAASTTAGSGHGGGSFIASNGNYLAGVAGIAYGPNGSNPRIFGVQGSASNYGSASTAVGGYFELTSGSYTYVIPSGVKAALVANNGSTTDDIFKAQDNGTDVFSIADGGATSIVLSAGTTSALTLNNGSASAPILTLKDNGTNKFVVADGGYMTHTVTGTVAGGNFAYLQLNSIAGNTELFDLGGVGHYGNYTQLTGSSSNTNSGHAASVFSASAANIIYGVAGLANGGNGTSPKSVGTYGYAAASGTPSTALGGYFEISSAADGYSVRPPSGMIAALAASNKTTTNDIFQAYDDSTAVFKVKDGGSIVHTVSGSTSGDVFSYDLRDSRTGSSTNYGMFVLNTSATSTDFNYTAYGTFGAYFDSEGANSTANKGNIGALGYARSGNKNVGLAGVTDLAAGTNNRSIGVIGYANSGSSSIDSLIGGYFTVGTDKFSGLPATTTAALIANNQSTTYDIFRAQDASTDVVKIVDGGTVELLTNASLSATADKVQLGGYDIAAGRRTLAIGVEETVTAEAVTSDATLVVRINGVDYKILLKT